jgi:hypothetical protein
MRTKYKLLFTAFFLTSFISFSQKEKLIAPIILDSNKVNMFIKYPKYKHGTYPGGFEQWKNDNPDLYKNEMWYYTESFYIKRDHLPTGITINEGMIDVSRFEVQRKENEEAIVTFGGYKDVMVLIPANLLIYKPE